MILLNANHLSLGPWPTPDLNACTEEVRARLNVWLGAFDDADRWRAMDFAGLVGFTYPNVGLADPDRGTAMLFDFARFAALIFMLDDWCDGQKHHNLSHVLAMYDRYLRELATFGGTYHVDENDVGRRRILWCNTPLHLRTLTEPERLLLSEWRALYSDITRSWVNQWWSKFSDWPDRFAESMREFWIDGCYVEANLASKDWVQDVAGYMDTRVHSVGLIPMLRLLELTHCGVAPDRASHPAFRRVHWRASRVIALANDVISFEHETAGNEFAQNVVVSLWQQGGRWNRPLADSAPAMIDRAVEMHNNEATELRSEILDLDSLMLSSSEQDYIDGIRHWLAGALHWQLSVTSRYRSPT